MTIPAPAPVPGLDVDRYLVAAAVVATCALFLPAAFDPVNVIKLTSLLIAAIGLLLSVTFRVARDRVLHVPAGPAAWVGGALALALVVATVVAPVTHIAVYGAYGRNSGLLAYAGALLLFFVGLRVFDRPGARVLIGGVVAAALFTATYGLLQKAGHDAIPWNNPFNPIIAGLGNPNFASGYLGVGVSIGAGGALWAGWALPWRVACGVTSGLCLLAAVLSSSVQGPIAAAGGLFVVAVAWSLNRTGRLRTGLLGGLGAVAVLGVLVLIVGAVTRTGPAGSIFSDNGSEARTFYWRAALTMFGDKPLLGVGLDQYGNFWRTARPASSVPFLGGPSYSDAAHSVPLQMAAQGGVLLAVTYAAFLLFTAYALVRGLLRLQGADRMLLGAVGAGWTAYQVQSFVSIDQVPLIVLHFALAGGVIAVSGLSGLREVRLPGALKPAVVHQNDQKARRRTAAALPVRRRSLAGADLAVLGVVGVLGLVAAYQALAPLRANIAIKDGDQILQTGNGTAAFADYTHATDLAPGNALYQIKIGGLLERATPPNLMLAQQAYEQAFRADPYEVNALRAAAGLAERNGQLEQARTMYAELARLDPWNEESLVPAATFELRHGGAQTALALMQDATARIPKVATLWATLGDARAVLGDVAGARTAYEQALTLEAGQPVATAGLRKLPA